VALSRVAGLVAEGAALADVLSVVVAEVSGVLGVPAVRLEQYEGGAELVVLAVTGWDRLAPGSRRPLESGSLAATVLQTGQPYDLAREAAVPIIVHGSVWGLMSVRAERDGALPDTTDTRLGKLAELVAVAIANAQARDELRSLADEHAALQRVATLVAGGTGTDRLFAAVCEEAGRLLVVPAIAIERYDEDDHTTVLATWGDIDVWEQAGFSVGSRWALDGPSVARTVLDTGRPAIITDYSELPGTIAEMVRAAPNAAWVGIPITVEGRTWGVIYACTSGLSTMELAPDVESRLARFTDLVALAVSNVHARDELRGLADEQAALRRVATLVAEGTDTESVFAAVCEEVGRLLEVPGVLVGRYDADRCTTLLGMWGETGMWERVGFELGRQFPLDGPSVSRMVLETGRPAMIADYSKLPGTIAAHVRAAPTASMAGVPIMVEGKTWGVLVASTDGLSATQLPAYVESQLARFTDLIAIAVSNLQAREELRSLAEEQAALRRIATLVADGADERVVFDAVCAETGRLVGASSVNLARFTPDAFYLAVAGWSLRDTHMPPGTHLPLEEGSLSGVVWRTGKPARKDSYENATNQLAGLARSLGIRCAVGVPIIVEGGLWGILIPGRDWDEPFAPGTEERVARFAELTATSISNATARSELIASRARIVAAGDEARRRIERNLHDGIQQRLIALSLDLESVRETIPPEEREARLGLDRLSRELEAVHDDLRQLSHGLHPAVLSRRGLAAALAAVVRRSPIPVTLQADIEERQPAPIEIGVYYVVAEALTNAAKHSHASEIRVSVVVSGDTIWATVADDGVGGADPGAGGGLTGLIDRVAALGGSLEIDSRRDGGTTISAVLPTGAEQA
jgi:signal transduction histidine kinase